MDGLNGSLVYLSGLTVLILCLATQSACNCRLTSPGVDVDARVIGDKYPCADTYEVVVPHHCESVSITPRAKDYEGSIYINGVPVSNNSPSGKFALNPGLNTFEIAIFNPDGTTDESRTLKVIRKYPTPNWMRLSEKSPWSPRDSAGELMFKDRMWLIGGYLPAVVGDVWSSSDGVNWEFAGNLPDPNGVSVPLAYVHDDKMWITTVSRKLYCSDDGRHWECALENLPWQGTLKFAGKLHGKLWGIGGADGRQVWSSIDGKNWKLELDGAPWSKRGIENVLVHADRLWVIGGSYGNYQPFKGYRDIWCSEDGIHWTLVTDQAPWEGRRWSSCVSYRNRIWLLGGFRAQPTWQNFNDVWYSADGVSWKQLVTEDIWSPRHEISTYVYQDRIWVVGGNAWPLTNDVWQLYIPGLSFVSQPVLEEYIGARYEYRAHAEFNASLKPVRYKLLEAPDWLTIDADTGTISGTPPATGNFRVAVQACDDAGETAVQEYTLHVINP